MTIGRVLIIVICCLCLSGCTSNNYYDYDYEEYDEEEYSTGITRDNWSCTGDCSGHEAGYDWAENEGITNPYDCDGNSTSFIEGCEAYANEQVEELYEYEDYPEDEYLY